MKNTGTFLLWVLIVGVIIYGVVWGTRRYGGLKGALSGWGLVIVGVIVIAAIVGFLRRRF